LAVGKKRGAAQRRKAEIRKAQNQEKTKISRTTTRKRRKEKEGGGGKGRALCKKGREGGQGGKTGNIVETFTSGAECGVHTFGSEKDDGGGEVDGVALDSIGGVSGVKGMQESNIRYREWSKRESNARRRGFMGNVWIGQGTQCLTLLRVDRLG